MGIPKSAVERQLDRLTDSWNVFAAKSEPRVLRWIADDNNEQLLDLFFTLQNEEEGSDIPDLFVPLQVPFQGADAYGFDLANEFQAMYDESRNYLEEAGLRGSWSPPQMKAGVNGIETFLRCCFAFYQEHQERMISLVLVLQPESIANLEQWQAWWQALLGWNLPAHIRFTTVEAASMPLLEALAASLPQKIVSIRPDVNVGPLMSEISASVRGDIAGTRFRRMFLEMANLSESGGIAAIQSRAAAALQIAQEQNWPSLAVTVLTLVGATHHRAGQFSEAMAAYRNASKHAEAAQQAGEPSGAKLLMQARFGEAAALLSANQYPHAAAAYAGIAPLAQQAGDPLMEVESWRMAGFSSEQSGQRDAAWQAYWQALQCGEKLQPEMRPASTLPQTGEALLRMAGSSDRATVQVHQRMIDLLGQSWPFTLQTGVATS